MPPFKDEHVLIIAPGSAITQAQLGLPETFTPPRWRFPTRMFPGLKEGEWEPVFVRERVKTKRPSNGKETNGISKDTDMVDATEEAAHKPSTTNGLPDSTNADSTVEALPIDSTGAVTSAVTQPEVSHQTIEEEEEEETEYYDDPTAIANAVYPIKSGRIENWPCFFALMSHIYQMISPPFHMPVLVVAQPCWTARDKEIITQYFFENWKIPALCVMDAALAATWGFGMPSACVIDVGQDKCDVSAVTEYVVNEIGRAIAVEGCGGSTLTARLREEFEKSTDQYPDIDDWTDFAEQLKRSPICEILSASMPLPGRAGPEVPPPNPLVAASTAPNNVLSNNTQSITETSTTTDEATGPEEEDNEGVLDVAAIVAQNNAAEILAKRERERLEKEAKKKGLQAEAQKQTRLKNSEKEKATFTYEEPVVPETKSDSNGTEPRSRKRKREIEVGLERFAAGTPSTGHTDGILDRIASAVHSTIMSVPDISSRSSLWENIMVLGNGSRVRGFTTALMETLSTRFTLSPSNTTIFTSELPSNFSTPVPTGGTNTPIPGQQHHHHSSGVNPLLVAATKNMMQPSGGAQHLTIPGQHLHPLAATHQLHPGGPGPGGYANPALENLQHHSYRGITQSPMTMKTVKAPDYFPEWKDPSVAGMEDAAFLGAQVAAKVVFIVDQGISKGFLTRSDYNELGPEGIHGCSM